MKTFIEEHGIVLLLVVIGIIIFVIMSNLLLIYQSSDTVQTTKAQPEINLIWSDPKPTLVMAALIIPKGTELDPLQEVYADDGLGNEITDQVRVYGVENVNVHQEGIYYLDYYVENQKGLMDYAQRTVIVEDINDHGELYVEGLTDNMELSSALQIQGWAVSTDESAQVQVFVDDQLIAENLERTENDDIHALLDSGYFASISALTNPMPGFKGELDLSSYQDDHIHLLCIALVSGKGDRIEEKEFTFKVTS